MKSSCKAQKRHDEPKKSRSADEIGQRYGQIEYSL